MPTIRNIKPEEVGNFGLDEQNRLYWNRKLIQTESVVVLTGKQNLWAIAVALATVCGSLAALVTAVSYVIVEQDNISFLRDESPAENARQDRVGNDWRNADKCSATSVIGSKTDRCSLYSVCRTPLMCFSAEACDSSF